ncbi:2-hydroxychromene-2-carboxylate isomerase [Lysobacter hankyongensis]|uniref:2-hydroxychromene-2-carboxylate isomerase n=1 Tax=Lysobacter hankyongensis TaxID=1176535 RepID=A0ABP9C0K4_9GAMM
MKLEFWFEFASTYSYVAAMRIEDAAARVGVEVEWRAFLLGPIFRQQGWTDSPFNLFPAKGRYMWQDLQRQCRKHGLPLRMPSMFPRNGLLAARLACAHADAPWLPAFVQAVYRANFEHDEDIADETVIAACLAHAGQDAASILPDAQLPAVKQALIARTGDAVRHGLFGAPSFRVGDDLFWGDDRLADALEACTALRSR